MSNAAERNQGHFVSPLSSMFISSSSLIKGSESDVSESGLSSEGPGSFERAGESGTGSCSCQATALFFKGIEFNGQIAALRFQRRDFILRLFQLASEFVDFLVLERQLGIQFVCTFFLLCQQALKVQAPNLFRFIFFGIDASRCQDGAQQEEHCHLRRQFCRK